MAGERRVPETLEEGALLAALGECSFLGQLCLTSACHVGWGGQVAIAHARFPDTRPVLVNSMT